MIAALLVELGSGLAAFDEAGKTSKGTFRAHSSMMPAIKSQCTKAASVANDLRR
jgi:hypothetical protein